MYRVCLATVPRPYQEVTHEYNKHASDWLTMNQVPAASYEPRP